MGIYQQKGRSHPLLFLDDKDLQLHDIDPKTVNEETFNAMVEILQEEAVDYLDRRLKEAYEKAKK
ncbi:hypothetical protein [Myxosarcina sp. GI1]|uniref:hypothetical protein n=1 Tax=Myxosarcina sp. GI1 TaxID=1541065 RepID=UPI00056CCCB3|nr:hypothetical protein [Myxosarcina sp. GI1]